MRAYLIHMNEKMKANKHLHVNVLYSIIEINAFSKEINKIYEKLKSFLSFNFK